MLARLIFAFVDFAARNGLSDPETSRGDENTRKDRARRTGIRGETYAYWYLRRHGYVLIARNYMCPGIKGEIDMIGCDGPVVAFVEVKTRAGSDRDSPDPEHAVNAEKRRYLARMAQHFLRSRRLTTNSWRFDVVAIETRPGRSPLIRLHKGAFVRD